MGCVTRRVTLPQTTLVEGSIPQKLVGIIVKCSQRLLWSTDVNMWLENHQNSFVGIYTRDELRQRETTADVNCHGRRVIGLAAPQNNY